MTCKDCYYNDNVHCSFVDDKGFKPEERKCFKDKRLVVELPCNVENFEKALKEKKNES